MAKESVLTSSWLKMIGAELAQVAVPQDLDVLMKLDLDAAPMGSVGVSYIRMVGGRISWTADAPMDRKADCSLQIPFDAADGIAGGGRTVAGTIKTFDGMAFTGDENAVNWFMAYGLPALSIALGRASGISAQ